MLKADEVSAAYHRHHYQRLWSRACADGEGLQTEDLLGDLDLAARLRGREGSLIDSVPAPILSLWNTSSVWLTQQAECRRSFEQGRGSVQTPSQTVGHSGRWSVAVSRLPHLSTSVWCVRRQSKLKHYYKKNSYGRSIRGRRCPGLLH